VENVVKAVKDDTVMNALKNADLIEILKKIVNSEEILGSGLIKHIEITGNADPKVKELLSQNDIKSLRIIDTRGFLDETPDSVLKDMERLKNNEGNGDKKEDINPEYDGSYTTEDALQKMLCERGLHKADAVVFMSVANSNALNKEVSREIYGPLIQELLKQHPTFLTIRDARLKDEFTSEQTSYLEARERLFQVDSFDGFDSIEELLEGYFSVSDTNSAVAQKHFNKLVLVNIPNKKINDEEFVKFYRKSVVGVLEEVIKGVSEYYKDLEEAGECWDQIMYQKLDKYEKLFDEYFDNKVKLDNGRVFVGKADNNDTNVLRWYAKDYAERIQQGYRGGLVGIRGGLTTHIRGEGYVGKFAIDLMEFAYCAKKHLNEQLVDKLEDEIKEYFKKISGNDNNDKAVEDMQKKMTEMLWDNLNKNLEDLSIKRVMISRSCLEWAYNETCEDLKVGPDHIGEYLKEYKNLYTIPDWYKERCYISVVKRIIWKMIERLLRSLRNDKQNSGDSKES
jgi:hypothetical protein